MCKKLNVQRAKHKDAKKSNTEGSPIVLEIHPV